MLEAAREHLEPEFGDRVNYLQASLDEIDLPRADLAFSNAAFHWIKDHPNLFRAIFRGSGPAAGWSRSAAADQHRPRARRAGRLMRPNRTVATSATGPVRGSSLHPNWPPALDEAGFVDVETSMFEAPVQLESRQETYDYFENVILGTHLERIPGPDLRERFLESMTEQSAADDPPFRQDYWRLNLRARSPAS